MANGIIAYQTEVNLIKKHVVNPTNIDNLEFVYETNFGKFQYLDQLYVGQDGLSAKEAMYDIYNGQINRTEPMSGIKYRYVAEMLFRIHYDCATRINNEKLYPDKYSDFGLLFEIYKGFPVEVPPIEEFPVTALIKNEDLKKLQKDYSILEIPEKYHKQFEEWISIGSKFYIEGESDLLLIYGYPDRWD